MKEDMFTLCYDVEKAIDFAFQGKFTLDLYKYLKINKAKRDFVEEFIESDTVSSINTVIDDLETYLEGGSDNLHKQLREAYGHIPKPQARKIKDYLMNIVDDAWRYKHDKRPGRRKKTTK
jgi:hypothetical protein